MGLVLTLAKAAHPPLEYGKNPKQYEKTYCHTVPKGFGNLPKPFGKGLKDIPSYKVCTGLSPCPTGIPISLLRYLQAFQRIKQLLLFH